MQKRRLFSSIGILVLLGGLFSCGGNDDKTIVFWHTSGAGIASGYEEAANNFAALVKENEGVDITIKPSYQGGYSDILDKVTKSLATGTGPTIAIAYPDHVANYISAENGVSEKYVVNMKTLADDATVGFGKESWIGDNNSSDFITNFYDEGQDYANEGMYSLPLMKSTEVMYYNKDIVLQYASGFDASLNSEAAVDSWLGGVSWDDFISFATYIRNHWTNGGKAGYFPIWYDSDSNLFISQAYQRNIPYISKKTDGTMSVDFNNDQSKALLTELKALHTGGILTTKGCEGTYGSSNFIESKCIFCIGSSGGAGYQDPSEAGFNYGISEVPYANNNKLYITQGPTLTLLKNTGSSDEVNDFKIKYAWKFIKYLTSTNVNMNLCVTDSQGYIPVRQSSYDTDDYVQYLKEDTIYSKTAQVVINDIQGHYLISPSIKGSAEARNAVGGLVTQVLLANQTIDDALTYYANQAVLGS